MTQTPKGWQVSSRPGRRIVVQGEIAAEARDAQSILQTSVVGPTASGELIIPSDAQFEKFLEDADDIERLTGLQKLTAAHKDVAIRCGLAFDESMRLAIRRLRVERKLGAELQHVVHRGGHGSKSSGVTSIRGGASEGLPAGITKQAAARFRKLAAIPDATFISYLACARKRHTSPSASGAIDYAEKADGSKPGHSKTTLKAPKPADFVGLSPTLLEAVQGFLPDISVCIGDAKVRCGTRLTASTASPRQIRGIVLVAECLHPGEWLRLLVKLRESCHINETVVVLPGATGTSWFKALGEDGWRCFFPTGEDRLFLAYLGPRTHGFAVTFGQHGLVMCGCVG